MSDDMDTPEGAPGAHDADASPPQVDAPSGVGAFFGPFFNAILAPAQTWEAIDAKPSLAVWIVVLIALFSTVLSVVNLPITQQVMAQTVQAQMRASGQDISPEQLQQQADIMATAGTVMAYASSVFIVLMIALTALVIWVLALIMGGKGASFGRAFGVAAGAAVIRPLLYSIYATVILNMNPPVIRRPEDASTIAPTLGLDLLLAGPDTPVWLTVIFQRIDLFNLWWMVLIVGGSMAVLKLKKGQAITVAAILWLLGTLIAVGGAMVSTMGSG